MRVNWAPRKPPGIPRDRLTTSSCGASTTQHITTSKLEAALGDVIREYVRFELPFLWGSGQAAIADGTHIALLENNLLGAQHVRYGRFGGIAYHHISDTYIALFSHFIACGVWEAVYILDGLLKNRSALQPTILHADTHGQAEPVFGLAALLGIDLLPRMRTWQDVTFYRVDAQTTYQHIDALFTQVVDWDLIARHWQDMMQVVLSIQAGHVVPSMLLRKLGVYSRHSALYKAFSELGRVQRTLFLLTYMIDPALQQHIRAETTKVEAYHHFTDWLAFGSPILRSGDPVEQEKRIKYRDLVANAVMLHNVVDMTKVLAALQQEGVEVTPEVAKCLSPYLTEHLKRFGQYMLDITVQPEPLQPPTALCDNCVRSLWHLFTRILKICPPRSARDGASSRRLRPSMASRNRPSIACCGSGGTPGRLDVQTEARPASYPKPNWSATSS